MTIDELEKANTLSHKIYIYQFRLREIQRVKKLFYNEDNENSTIYDKTVKAITVVVEDTNDGKTKVELPKDSPFGRELIANLEKYYREQEEKTQKEFDSFLAVEDVN